MKFSICYFGALVAFTLAGDLPCNNPIILVPGLGGSVLDVNVSKDFPWPNSWCSHIFDNPGEFTSGLSRLWPSFAALDFIGKAEARACNFALMKTHVDPVTLELTSAPGIEVRPRDFGGVDGISNLFALWGTESQEVGIPTSSVYEDLVKKLTASGTYAAHKNLRGMPYDFRLVTSKSYMNQLFAAFKAEIEDAVEGSYRNSSCREKAYVMTHSLGGPTFQYFLNHFVDAKWKAKYIALFVPVSAPWRGAFKALRALLSGDTEGMPGNNIDFQPIEGTMGGLLWMAPFPTFYADSPVVSTPTANYTTSPASVQALMKNVSLNETGALLATPVHAMYEGQVPPGVPTVCVFGHGVPTERYFVYPSSSVGSNGAITGDPAMYREDFKDPKSGETITAPDPRLLMPKGSFKSASYDNGYSQDPNQGDGTVPIDSLKVCQDWSSQDNANTPVRYKSILGASHLGILQTDDFLTFAKNLLFISNSGQLNQIFTEADPFTETLEQPASPKVVETHTATPYSMLVVSIILAVVGVGSLVAVVAVRMRSKSPNLTNSFTRDFAKLDQHEMP